jgi:hypothetical protein
MAAGLDSGRFGFAQGGCKGVLRGEGAYFFLFCPLPRLLLTSRAAAGCHCHSRPRRVLHRPRQERHPSLATRAGHSTAPPTRRYWGIERTVGSDGAHITCAVAVGGGPGEGLGRWEGECSDDFGQGPSLFSLSFPPFFDCAFRPKTEDRAKGRTTSLRYSNLSRVNTISRSTSLSSARPAASSLSASQKPTLQQPD